MFWIQFSPWKYSLCHDKQYNNFIIITIIIIIIKNKRIQVTLKR